MKLPKLFMKHIAQHYLIGKPYDHGTIVLTRTGYTLKYWNDKGGSASIQRSWFAPYYRVRWHLHQWRFKMSLKWNGFIPQRCEGCGEGWATHLVQNPNHGEKDYFLTCEACLFIYGFKEMMRFHQRERRPIKRVFKCKACATGTDSCWHSGKGEKIFAQQYCSYHKTLYNVAVWYLRAKKTKDKIDVVMAMRLQGREECFRIFEKAGCQFYGVSKVRKQNTTKF